MSDPYREVGMDQPHLRMSRETTEIARGTIRVLATRIEALEQALRPFAAVTEQFVADLASFGVTLPLTISEDDDASLIDAEGRDVVGVLDGDFTDAEARRIAAWIMLAVNTCGGFRAARAAQHSAAPDEEHAHG
jgi:hypothetical protein